MSRNVEGRIQSIGGYSIEYSDRPPLQSAVRALTLEELKRETAETDKRTKEIQREAEQVRLGIVRFWAAYLMGAVFGGSLVYGLLWGRG